MKRNYGQRNLLAKSFIDGEAEGSGSGHDDSHGDSSESSNSSHSSHSATGEDNISETTKRARYREADEFIDTNPFGKFGRNYDIGDVDDDDDTRLVEQRPASALPDLPGNEFQFKWHDIWKHHMMLGSAKYVEMDYIKRLEWELRSRELSAAAIHGLDNTDCGDACSRCYYQRVLEQILAVGHSYLRVAERALREINSREMVDKAYAYIASNLNGGPYYRKLDEEGLYQQRDRAYTIFTPGCRGLVKAEKSGVLEVPPTMINTWLIEQEMNWRFGHND